MKFIIGKKLGMSQVFKEDGTALAVTLVEVKPNIVVQVKTKEKDGYEAVQFGSGEKKKIAKPQKGHFKNLGNFRSLKEFKALKIDDKELQVGDKIDASVFSAGDKVKVTAITKGKGFAGVMKRHGFSGMPHSHGHHHVARHGGSIGQRFPQHTLKGMKMPGRMGNHKLTVRGLEIIEVNPEKGYLAIKGAVPGNKGGIVQITSLK